MKVNVKALEAAHLFTSVENTQYTLISRDEFHALIAALRIAVEALRLADEWRGLDGDGITDPTRLMIKDALARIEARVEGI